MSRFRLILILFFLGILLHTGKAQKMEIDYKVEANIIAGGGDYTPFYLMNNRGGTVSFTPNTGYLRAAIEKDIDTTRRFSYGFGLDAMASYNDEIPAYIQQAYASIRFLALGITVGSQEEYSLLWDKDLSSGGWVWSGNSRPIPQVRIGIPEFVNFPGTHGKMQIKGEISYGRFVDDKYQRQNRGENMKYTTGQLYHRKNLLLRFGKTSKHYYGIVGIDMAAQFGGTVYNKNAAPIYFPSNLKEYFKVFIPLAGGENSPGIDQVNVSGNHLGSYLFAVGTRQKNWKGRIYYEHPFDDHSGMIFRNKSDGLWGIEYRSTLPHPVLSGIVVEFLETRDQSGPFLYDATTTIPIQVSAGDWYYGHVVYNGWTHRGHTIGNPFITSPGYNDDGFLGFKSSRMEALHIGWEGYFTSEFDYRFLGSLQRGWGTPYVP
ncbi:MAG: capsule assembly Wzi family protein, partial [Porphyromonadaceae bacterium]|nr:capsule assembly Wzi family protein [Porphyromonadaceae bacterium]